MFQQDISGLSESQEQAVREELHRLLEGAAFRTSKRCREFLEYIVVHTISGPSGALKERSIGVELFLLPQDFDTGQHTIVRVTANEIRKRLAQHYLAENGSSHPVKIALPPGSYSAEFTWSARTQAPDISQQPETEIQPQLRPGGPISGLSSWLTRPILWCVMAVILIAAVFAFRPGGVEKPMSVDAKSLAVSETVPKALAELRSMRIVAGSANQYVDRSGRPWGPDRFFSGGNIVVRPSERIFRTLDPDIFRHLRSGDFQYDIPLEPGIYELHLYFAETGLSDFISAESSGEGQRLFRVSANGNRILNAFDVVADAAGSNIADERVFRNISPAEDGFLHLSFNSMRSTAMLNGIEVLPLSGGKVRPVRIRTGWTSSWQDSAGQQWQADSYFLGGNALVRTTNPAQDGNSIAPDSAIYTSERWGHFSYAVPVADGRFRVTLKFCEGHYGKRNTGVGGLGSRVFDVYSNGVALMRNFDIYKEAGGEGRPIDRTFSGVRPNAQGKIVLSFVPIAGMACVNGIEVVEDSK